MDMSIIIRVKDDVRIKKCIETIDENVETIVVLNTPTPQIREIVGNLNVKTLEIDNNNLALAYNIGIKASKYDKVLLMDADCTFRKGTIKKLYDGLSRAHLSKGRVLFNHSSLVGRIVALSREYHITDLINAYAPPLAFNKSIKDYVGGYYFDEDIFWTEDHEFDQRVKKAELPIEYIPEAIIDHDELSICSDLKSSFYYGAGYYEGIRKGATKPCFIYGGQKTFPGSILYDATRAIALPLLFIDVSKKKGILPAVFMSAWMVAFATGYYAQGLFDILGAHKNNRINHSGDK